MKQKLILFFLAMVGAMGLAPVAMAEPEAPTIDWSTLIPEVASAFTTMVSEFMAEVDPIIVAGLGVTIALIGVGLIRKFLARSGGR